MRSLAAIVLTLSTVVAHAHSMPKLMVPDANSTVAPPPQVSVVFTEALESKFSSLKITNSKGTTLGQPSIVDPADHKRMTLALPSLPPGTYTVHWATAATDGHRADGQYTFTVK